MTDLTALPGGAVELPDGFAPDVVVLGAGLTGCLLAIELVTLDPDVQVLLLDAGERVAADHGQVTLAGLSFLDGLATESWEAGSRFTAPGLVHAVGGGSLAWSAWSPEPRPEELAYWPDRVAAALTGGLLDDARRRLGVTGRHSGTAVARAVADQITGAGRRLRGVGESSGEVCRPAPIALAAAGHAYSPVPCLSGHAPRLRLLPVHRVLAVDVRAGRVAGVVTSRGRLPVSRGTRVVLALNTVESTRQVLLAAPELAHAGRYLAAHAVCEVSLRVPLDRARDGFEWGALLVPGRSGDRSFHVQIHAGAGEVPADRSAFLRRLVPGLSGAELLAGSDRGHLVLNLATLGELPARGDGESDVRLSRTRFDAFGLPLATVTFRPDAERDPVWDAMDDTLDDLCATLGRPGTGFRTAGDRLDAWRPAVPPRRSTRDGGRRWERCVHMSGTLRIGEDGVTDETGGIRGIDGLFAAGLALFPRPGSHNGGLAAVALALHLARHLVQA